MSSNDKNSGPDEHEMSRDDSSSTSAAVGEREPAIARNNGEATASLPRPTSSSHGLDMKRHLAKELIERYFFQLQRGCGNPKCTNVNCASSGKVPSMNPNEIAAKAIQLFSQEAKLCDCSSSTNCGPSSESQGQQTSLQMPRAQTSSSSHSTVATVTRAPSADLSSPTNGSSSSSSSSTTSSYTNSDKNTTITSKSSSSNDTTRNSPLAQNQKKKQACAKKEDVNSPSDTVSAADTPESDALELTHLDEFIVNKLLSHCEQKNNYLCLLDAVAEIFSSVEKLGQSFRLSFAAAKNTEQLADKDSKKLHKILWKSPSDLNKEDLRTLEGEHDKDEDSTCVNGQTQPEFIRTSTPTEDPASVTLPNSSHPPGLASSDDTSDSHIPFNALQGDALREFVLGLDLPNLERHTYESNSQEHTMTVDLPSLRRVKKKLSAVEGSIVSQALNSNIEVLANAIESHHQKLHQDDIVHCLIVCFDMATDVSDNFADFEFLEPCLPKLCHVASALPVSIQARLARIWARYCKDRLQMMVRCYQQLISLQAVLLEDAVQHSPDIIAITKVMKIAYYANILAGESDPLKEPENDVSDADAKASEPESSTNNASSRPCSSTNPESERNRVWVFPDLHLDGSDDDSDDIYYMPSMTNSKYPKFAVDRLAIELNINVLECHIPIVPFEEFYNEPLSECVRMEKDYMSFRNLSLDPRGEASHFSFMLYAFILTPAAKYSGLYFDNRIRMYSERDRTFMSLLDDSDDSSSDIQSRPDLQLKVRRDRIVRDALIGLEMIAINSPKTLKKQLAVEFVGEEGIDEGGVSKEFFQLIVEEIFNADYGMFLEQKDTNLMWFNSSSFENEAQYTLIGIIIGLAIYNSVVLPLRFPMVVYRKLMGGNGTFHDLKDWSPTLYSSLKSLLEYEGDDIESTFMLTFKINYENVFGEVIDHELKPDGDNILVNQSNKREFIKLYVDYLLNESIERQFKAFKKGFDMVTDESPLKLLFRPDEIEVLVCGSKVFDFVELEKSTQYDGGYTKDSQIIKDFWNIVHAMPEESKRKLLEFTTGSDRVPVGGLSRVRLVITRHGPDTDRLPTSHTCFNILLLPEYSSKEKLEERLVKAINYSKGFGML